MKGRTIRPDDNLRELRAYQLELRRAITNVLIESWYQRETVGLAVQAFDNVARERAA